MIHREFYSAYPAKLIIENDNVRTENANRPHGFGLIDADNFLPYPKNPAISKFFREIGLADELGSGIRNINKYLEVYSGGKPEFHEADVFTLIVPIKKQREITDASTHQDKMEALIEFFRIPRNQYILFFSSNIIALLKKVNFCETVRKIFFLC